MPRIAVPVVLVVVLALGTGCGGSDDPGAEPSDATTSASPTTPSDSPTESEPTVEPATGVLLTMPHATVRAPEDWEKADEILAIETGANDDDTPSLLSLGEITAFGGTPTLDELVDTFFHTSPYPMKPKELPPIEVDGVEMYHLAGRVQPLNHLEEFGVVVDGRTVTLSFQFTTRLPAAERQEIVDSVLASFRWR